MNQAGITVKISIILPMRLALLCANSETEYLDLKWQLAW